MEEFEQEEEKAIQNWQLEERRRASSGEYKGDERRKSEAGKPPIGDSDADEAEGR